jgi:predicted dehydrogenase
MTVPALRIGIAGLGFGQAVLLPVFTSLPGVEVVAVAATRPDKARPVAERFSVPEVACDLEAFLDRGLDAVALALPPAVGAGYAEAALARGLAVLTEKPIAASLAGARRLAELGAGRTCTVDFTFAEIPAFQALHQALTRRTFGAVREIGISWLTESYAHHHRAWGWKLDAERGGGVMTHQGSHIFYLLEWLFGPLRIEQAAFDRRATAAIAPAGARAAEDTVRLALRLGDDTPVSVSLSNAAPGNDGLHRWEIVCDRAALTLSRQGPGVMDGFSLRARDHRTGETSILQTATADSGAGGRIEPFRRLAARFVAAVRAGTGCPPDFKAGLRVQDLMAAAAALAGASEDL